MFILWIYKKESLQFVLPWFLSDTASCWLGKGYKERAFERAIKKLGSINVMMGVKENGWY